MYNLPFPPDKPLVESIKNEYLMNALKWVGDFRDPNSKELLGVKTGSLWGVGYGLRCLIEARNIYLASDAFPGDFDDKAGSATRFLIKKASFGRDNCNWEGNIWDTAVICRALLFYTQIYPDLSRQANTTAVCRKALRWLSIQVEKWRTIRYALGIPDLSQILRTFILAQEIMPKEFEAITREIRDESSSDNLLEDLVDEIVHSVELSSQLLDGHSENVAIWDDDVFATADAIISLSKCVTSPAFQNNSRIGASTILEILEPAIRYLELEQVDGKWGIEETTAVALRAYIAGCKALGAGRTPEPHIVFKAVRYLCDPKTVFSDGSIAHEMEPTVYMILALIEVLNNWQLPDGLCDKKPTIELYDYIIWSTPTRSTHERVLRMQAQTEADQLRDKNKSLIYNLTEKDREIRWWRTIFFILIWATVGSIIAIMLSFVVVGLGKEFTLPFVNIKVTDWEVFLAFVTPWGGLGWFIYDRLLRWNTLQEDNK